MRKIFTLLAVSAVLILVFSLWLYFDFQRANHDAREDYLITYNRCLDDLHKSQPANVDAGDAKGCVDRGGCPMECGSACGETKPFVTFDEYWRGLLSGPRACILLCVPYCIYPIESGRPGERIQPSSPVQ